MANRTTASRASNHREGIGVPFRATALPGAADALGNKIMSNWLRIILFHPGTER
jgi:hypothetical protein